MNKVIAPKVNFLRVILSAVPSKRRDTGFSRRSSAASQNSRLSSIVFEHSQHVSVTGADPSRVLNVTVEF